MSSPTYWQEAIEELSQNDKVMAAIIASYQGEMLKSRGDPFQSLARSIVGQQISVAAAASVWNKLETQVKEVAPISINKSTDEELRSAGLSRQKIGYLNDLATKFLEKDIDIESFHDKDDEEVITDLTTIKGIGRWTAEMFLIFYLLRPDVYPVADIGLQKAVMKHYDTEDLDIGVQWKPWRSVATWYLWRSLDPLPVEY